MASYRTVVVFLAVIVAVHAASTAKRERREEEEDDEKYTQRFDSVNIDEILNSDRLLDNYYNCIMDEGRCTPDAMELKRVLPEAISNKCTKCSEKQKQGAEKVLLFLIKNKPEQWAKLEKRYDPTGNFRKLYEKEAAERGVSL